MRWIPTGRRRPERGPPPPKGTLPEVVIAASSGLYNTGKATTNSVMCLGEAQEVAVASARTRAPSGGGYTASLTGESRIRFNQRPRRLQPSRRLTVNPPLPPDDGRGVASSAQAGANGLTFLLQTTRPLFIFTHILLRGVETQRDLASDLGTPSTSAHPPNPTKPA